MKSPSAKSPSAKSPSAKSPSASAQSIKQRLLDTARRRKQDFNRTLVRYGTERFLYRLSRSKLVDKYVLKGATLFYIWDTQTYRPTRDLDLNCLGGGVQDLSSEIQEICAVNCPEDALKFDHSTAKTRSIRANQRPRGQSARFRALLGGIPIPLRLDVAFGDLIRPEPVRDRFPTLLDHPAPEIKTYPKEAFIAEKFEAMAKLGTKNTRIKDFWDVAVLASLESFAGSTLQDAVSATFEHRGTAFDLDNRPAVLRAAFYSGEDRDRAWRGLGFRGLPLERSSFQQAGELLISFLEPLWEANANGRELRSGWEPGGPWLPLAST